MNFAARVRQLDLPMDEIVVVGSGLLDLLGFRAAHDIDITASPRVFERLEADTRFTATEKYGHSCLVNADASVEVWPYFMDWVSDVPFDYESVSANSIMIDGIRCISPQFLLMWKRRARRDKDEADISFLTAYMQKERS